VRTIFLSDETLDKADVDDNRSLVKDTKNGLGRLNPDFQEPETLLDVFDSYEDELFLDEDEDEDEDSKMFGEDYE